MVIDPGTGDYHGNPELRSWLASREAHNGPCPDGIKLARRDGPFLWSGIHPRPLWDFDGETLETEIRLAGGSLARTVRPLAGNSEGWFVSDLFEPQLGQTGAFSVCWQFATGCEVERSNERIFRVTSGVAMMEVEIGDGWSRAELWRPSGDETVGQLEGVVSPRFMKTEHAPYLKLTAKPGGSTAFTTRFAEA